MNLNKLYLLLIGFLCAGAFSTSLHAQDATTANGFGVNHNLHLTYGLGVGAVPESDDASSSLLSLSWTHFYGIGAKKNLRLGYGVRFNSFSGKNLAYSTADAKLISDDQIDTIGVAKANTNNIAITLNAKYRLIDKLDIGFNIDALGLGFGGEKETSLTNTNDASLTSFDTNNNASPTSMSVLLVGDRDIGMLNSEIYVGYWFTENLNARLGYSFLFTEYTTENELGFDNDRFRNKSGYLIFSVGYSPGRN